MSTVLCPSCQSHFPSVYSSFITLPPLFFPSTAQFFSVHRYSLTRTTIYSRLPFHLAYQHSAQLKYTHAHIHKHCTMTHTHFLKGQRETFKLKSLYQTWFYNMHPVSSTAYLNFRWTQKRKCSKPLTSLNNWTAWLSITLSGTLIGWELTISSSTWNTSKCLCVPFTCNSGSSLHV